MNITIEIPDEKVDVVRDNLERLANTEVEFSQNGVFINFNIPEKTVNDLAYAKLILRLMLRKIITLAKYNQDLKEYRINIEQVGIPYPEELID